jgi:hypothetical protein
VRANWFGARDPAVRQEVVRQLNELFPDARFVVRRW